jgi:ethanolamine utilization protein EutA
VTDTASLFAAARHFEFQPGTYRIARLSACAENLLGHLKIGRRVGDTLASYEVDAILDFYLDLIQAAALGKPDFLVTPIARQHVQAVPKFSSPPDPNTLITLSGGVGQLVYDHLRGQAEQSATRFGDFGGELAARIAGAPAITDRMGRLAPEGLGRATVYGLMRHSTELSGSTLYLPHPERLPLANVPLVGRFGPATSDEKLTFLLDLAAHGEPAACLQVELAQPTLDVVRNLGQRLARLLAERPRPPGHTLVLLVPANSGKVLGNYITRWGTLEVDLIVVDEVPLGEEQFVRLGRAREGVVPLWLYSVQ